LAIRESAVSRLSQVASFVRLNGYVRISELAQVVGVSEITIRRDLKKLALEGHLRSVPGGATPDGITGSMITFKREVGLHRAEKMAIGKAAAALVKDGDSVLFDGGSSTYFVARALVGRAIHVFTNSLPVAEVFSADSRVDVILLGGVLYPATGMTLGTISESQLKSFHPKWLFMGVGGIEPGGFSNSNLPLVSTERVMMETAENVVIVADSSKFGRQALARLGILKDADYLVTDSGIPPSARKWIREAGVELVISSGKGQHSPTNNEGSMGMTERGKAAA